MRSTLLYIPHADPFWDIPVFGYGWLLMIVVADRRGRDRVPRVPSRLEPHRLGGSSHPVGVCRGRGLGRTAARTAKFHGPPLGIPIRAYGVMVLLGIAAGIAMSVQQARRMGVDPEVVFSLCFWIIVAGFVGARTFYVLEYWEQFARPTFRETVFQIVNLTDGGLVVYGSFIGAALACVGYVAQAPIAAAGHGRSAGAGT